LVAAGLFVLDQFAWVNVLTLQLLFVAGLAVRLLAHWGDMTLPKISLGSSEE